MKNYEKLLETKKTKNKKKLINKIKVSGREEKII